MPCPSTLSAPDRQGERVVLPVIAVLVESGLRLILFDTGCHPDAMHGRWPATWAEYFAFSASATQNLPDQLALAGYAPSDVTDVVLSHLHMDHAGNVALFRDARVWVHRREVEYALAERLTSTDYVGPYVTEDWLLEGLNWRFVYGPAAITTEVRLIPMAGHTPGTLCMAVVTESRRLVFPSDSMYAAENMGPPVRLPGVIYDSVGFRETADRLAFMRDETGALVIYPHDPAQFETIMTAPQWYE